MVLHRSPFRRTTILLAALLLTTPAAFAGAAGGGLPWEPPLNRIAQSLTGPVALSISLIALMVASGTLVFGGELSVLGAGFMTTLFGVGGATVL